MVRDVFEVGITAMEETSASVVIYSLIPERFNWFGAWEGTTENWVVKDNDWVLSGSRTEAFNNSAFIQTYFGN